MEGRNSIFCISQYQTLATEVRKHLPESKVIDIRTEDEWSSSPISEEDVNKLPQDLDIVLSYGSIIGHLLKRGKTIKWAQNIHVALKMQTKVCVASTVPRLASAVRCILPSVEVIDASSPGNERMKIPDDTEILFRDTAQIITTVKTQTSLRWAQSTWAGVERLFKDFPKPPDGVIITRMGDGYGEIMAEYVLGQIIAREKCFFSFHDQQKEGKWNRIGLLPRRALSSVTIGILGVGSISSRVAQYCKSVGMTVWGLSKQKKTPEEAKHFDFLKVTSELTEFLSNCDYLCNVLPSTTQTQNLLSGDVLSCCQSKKPVFINIGRGDIISDESLLNAIESGWLSAAILDVFTTEPLPHESPLWSHKNITITPHIAGPCIPEIIAKVFASNYQKFIDGKPLDYVVNWDKGY